MRISILFVLALAASACTTIYKPSAATVPASLGRDDAEVALIRALKWTGRYDDVLTGDTTFRFVYKYPDDGATVSGTCPYAGTPAPDVAHVVSRPGHDYSTSDVALAACRSGSGQDWHHTVVWGGSENQRADRFADALFVLANGPPSDPAQDPEFQRAVQQYRAAGGRMQVGEEVRAHRVAAEEAVKEKRFEDAVNEYGEGLKLAPAWPQGHFNRALILAELGAYGAATRGMKRYLLLEPDAENARQVQDKVYAWQAKVK